MTTVEVNRAYEPPASELELQMKYGSPSKCIALSHSAPSVQMYYALRVRLETSSETWLQEYMDLDGLDSLLDSLSNMTRKGFTSFSDAILRLDCISCIRAILNTSVGLDYMVQNESYVAKLALAVDVGNTLPKKLVFEMLSAICAYNSLGYHSVLSALNHVKRELNLGHRFVVIINELKTAETAANKTAILTLINCIINCTSNVVDRNRIRTEFAGLNLLDILCFLRKEETDNDLHLQLQIFHERKHEDDDVLSQEIGATDFNSPEELIDIIQSKIFGSAKMASFVNILQDMLSIELMYNKNSSKLWKVVEDLVHETVHSNSSMELSTDMSALELRTLPDHINIGLECIKQYQSESKLPHYQLIKKQQILWHEKSNFTGSDRTKYDNDTGVELTHNQIRYDTCDNVTDVLDYIDQSHCESAFLKVNESIYDNHTPTNKSALQKRYKIRRFPVPPPSKKLKSFQWVKLSEDTIDKHSNCIWQSTSPCSRFKPDYEQLEKMFHLNDSGFEDMDEVVILNSETRKNLNLFLSRVDIGAEDLLQGIENENLEIITLPTLKYLQRVLPQKEEIDMLREFDGRRLDLGVPEQFVLLLTDIPEYDVLLQGFMTKLEYTESMEKLKSSLDVMTSICKIVLENHDFQEFFHFVLNTGNFLNHGCLQGDAAGFKLASLERMMRVKSNIPNQTLLHHVIKLIHQSDDAFLSFLKDLLGLEKKCGCTLHDIKNEINRCNKDLCQFVQLLSASSVKMKVRFQPFIDDTRTELLGIQSLTMKLREMSHRIANYFCEDEKKFNLEDCLQSILQFCKLIRKCHTENITFCKQTQLATRKTDQLKTRFKNKLLSLEFGKDAGASSSILEDRNKVLDRILDDLHSGNFRPVVKSGAITPETDTEALEVSHISFIGSPFPLRPSCETLDDEDFINTPRNLNMRTSSAADILSDEPCTEKQEVIPKEVPLNEHNYQDNGPEEMLDLSYIKPLNKTIDLIKNEGKRTKGHNRSRSDFTDSVLVTEPWMIQEVRQHDVLFEAPLAEPESMCALSTLNLENHGKFIDQEDVKHFEEQQKLDVKTDVYVIPLGPVLKLPLAQVQLPEIKNEPETKTKPEKRMSFGKILRNKLSRVVLRPKNDGGTLGPVQDKKRFGLFGRRKVLVSSSDKENLPIDDIENQNIDKKQNAKEKVMKIDKLRETNI